MTAPLRASPSASDGRPDKAARRPLVLGDRQIDAYLAARDVVRRFRLASCPMHARGADAGRPAPPA